MIQAFVRPFEAIKKNPKLLLVSVKVNALILVLFFATSYLGTTLVEEIYLQSSFGELTISSFLGLVQSNLLGAVSYVVAIFASLVLGLFLMFYYSRYLKNKEKHEQSFNESLQKIPELVLLGLFIAVVLLAISAVFFFIATYVPTIVAIILTILGVLLLFYFNLKLMMTVPAMAEKNQKITDGLKGAWNFSKGKLLKLLILTIGLFVIGIAFDGASEFFAGIADQIVSAITLTFFPNLIAQPFVGILFDPLFYEALVFLVLNSVFLAYYNLAFGNFYLSE